MSEARRTRCLWMIAIALGLTPLLSGCNFDMGFPGGGVNLQSGPFGGLLNVAFPGGGVKVSGGPGGGTVNVGFPGGGVNVSGGPGGGSVSVAAPGFSMNLLGQGASFSGIRSR